MTLGDIYIQCCVAQWLDRDKESSPTVIHEERYHDKTNYKITLFCQM